MRAITAREFDEWLAYANLEPFGEERADLRHGIQTAAIVNTMRGLWAKDAESVSPFDFMPFSERPPDPEQPELSADEVSDKVINVFSKLAGVA